MKTDINELRNKIAQLYRKRDRGNLTEKHFQQKLTEHTVALYRALVRKKMAEGEIIACEHHTILSHFQLMQSILQEPTQHVTSLFLTDRRLYRLQSTIMPERPPTADGRDQTSVDVITLDCIHALNTKFQIRIGELLLGAGFCGFAVMFHSWLAITGPVLVGLGALGVLHALILPTRWIEVRTLATRAAINPIVIHAVRKDSAKKLVRLLKDKLKHSCSDKGAAYECRA
jgi:hypothetical protein